MMLQKIGIAQLNVFCTALCLTISDIRRITHPSTYYRYFGHYQVQLSPSLFFESVRSNDQSQDHSESKGLVMGRQAHDQIFSGSKV